MEASKWVTVEEAAEFLNVSSRTIWRRIKNGTLEINRTITPHVVKLPEDKSRSLLIKIKAIEALVELLNTEREDIKLEAAKLLLYFLDDTSIAGLFESAIITKDESTSADSRKPPIDGQQGDDGYVYLMQSGGYYKIGASKDPDKRRDYLGTKPPFEIEIICTIETDDMYELEGQLHAQFSDKRVNGEWFELEPDDIAYIKELANEQ